MARVMGRILIVAAAVASAALLGCVASGARAASPEGADKPGSETDASFVLHGGLGVGKLLEIGAPGGGFGLAAGVLYRPSRGPLAAGLDLGYFLLGEKGETIYAPECADSIAATTGLSIIPVAAQLYYNFPERGRTGGFLEIGAGMYNLRSSVDPERPPTGPSCSAPSDSRTRFGIQFGSGFLFGNPGARTALGIEGRFHLILTEGKSTNVLTVLAKILYR